MAKFPRVGHMYKDRYGHTVRVVSTCADKQRVAYQLKGYDWTINAALIVFNARFRRDAA
ncbi:DUF4222 domain-containing protein [Edwardsiella tarda]|uniref:DUF4222 domain-containing protein n=2 Tax=Edwardsiella tarda TaxID=636 RepID=D4F835_EDWTA|nr:DUF4222 domain-containing protein [Edwardsiella tarda]EFE22076.1 hypothetical protein EDWATA_02922 [Edwardsiella tarda ATCC 23685]UCQ16903.1 DUF4222 domain-containing protein [Edwardsiella tarda]UCQ18714.1 DUF4222 domain-containing protein [Edwardsiella tarda]STD42457.1 Uncharacterised protein [Edwardsiella tarda]GAC64014.1 hypothetical protein ET1_08_00870 [Edwardsiella tarda ATCC 15947 = NBRC 105688]